MTGALLKVCALALICVSVGAVMKQIRGEMSFAVRVAGIVLIFSVAVITVEPLIRSLWGISERLDQVSEYVAVMVKALGVAILTQICSQICNDCGERGIAGGVELAGKLEILRL